MKKKNLIILLIIPFIISLLGIITVNVSMNFLDADITSIAWDYEDVQGFKVDQRHRLTASGVYPDNTVVGDGNNLIWSVKNKDDSDLEPHAQIIEEGGVYYLLPLSNGEVIVTCSNIKGNVSRSMNVVVYTDRAILLSTKQSSSQNNVDPTIYYGQYEDVSKNKLLSIDLNITTIPNSLYNQVKVVNQTENIEVDLASKQVRFKSGYNLQSNEKASFTLGFDLESTDTYTLDFEIVKDGINVETYDELLECTNKSKKGEIVVLRKSFESLATYNSTKEKNIELFGKYDANSKTYNFKNEVYSFETTFNSEYIDQWNEFAKKNSMLYTTTDKTIYAGLRVQKDFYGNGYTLNFHNLTYPYLTLKVDGGDGKFYDVPELSEDNVFRGPKQFYTLGDPNGLPLITAFGQDNSGMYIDGNNIVINDVNVKNCDFGNAFTNLNYVGSVMDLHGDNITIKNSRLANGKNVLRSFSSNNVVVDNCMLSNSRNFLITTGSNEYEKVDGNKIHEFIGSEGNVSSSTSEYLKAGALGDTLVTNYVMGEFTDKELMKQQLLSIDKALNDVDKVKDIYKGSMEINNTLFYRSGISSIALETYFNGPYLYSKAPSLIGQMFSSMSYEDKPMVPLEPENISGISYPVKVNISGDTRFYDYKDLTTLDISGLINENISTFANSIFEGQDIRKITIDDIFPIKGMLTSKASSSNCVYSHTENEQTSRYINVPIAYYGGGLNLSKVTYENYKYASSLSKDLPIDLISTYLDMTSGEGLVSMMRTLMVKTVTAVIGCQDFKFVCTYNNGELLEVVFNKAPSVETLKNNVKGV